MKYMRLVLLREAALEELPFSDRASLTMHTAANPRSRRAASKSKQRAISGDVRVDGCLSE
jgi:hypothetical protein